MTTLVNAPPAVAPHQRCIGAKQIRCPGSRVPPAVPFMRTVDSPPEFVSSSSRSLALRLRTYRRSQGQRRAPHFAASMPAPLDAYEVGHVSQASGHDPLLSYTFIDEQFNGRAQMKAHCHVHLQHSAWYCIALRSNCAEYTFNVDD